MFRLSTGYDCQAHLDLLVRESQETSFTHRDTQLLVHEKIVHDLIQAILKKPTLLLTKILSIFFAEQFEGGLHVVIKGAVPCAFGNFVEDIVGTNVILVDIFYILLYLCLEHTDIIDKLFNTFSAIDVIYPI